MLIFGFDWLTLKEFNFLLSTRIDFSSGLDHFPPDVKESHILKTSDIPGLLGQGSRTLNKTPNAIGRSRQVKTKGARSRDGSSGQKACESSIYIEKGDLVEIKVTHIEHLTSTPAIV